MVPPEEASQEEDFSLSTVTSLLQYVTSLLQAEL
jgi:hypothetical protein